VQSPNNHTVRRIPGTQRDKVLGRLDLDEDNDVVQWGPSAGGSYPSRWCVFPFVRMMASQKGSFHKN